MAQAFPDIPEPPAASEPPLEAMAACNQRLLRHCACLRRLAMEVRECGFDGPPRTAMLALFDFFDRILPLQHSAQEAALFPALIESMAGSDAVCLREITHGLAQQHRELGRLWQRLRPVLLELADGGAGALPVHEIEAFIAHCQAGVARENGELLPTAARLLSDGDLERIGAALRQPGPRPR